MGKTESGNSLTIIRRQMLAGLSLGAAGLAVGMTGCANQDAQMPPTGERGENEAPSLKEPTETIDVDIAVVGSGMDGMSAAVTAAEEGASVVVLEKQSILGGSTNFAEGVFGMGSQLQKEAGMGEPFRLMAPIVGTTVEPLGVASPLASLGAMNPYALWVNQDGLRFANEGFTRAYTTSANAVESQYRTFSIVDQKLFDRLVADGDPAVGWGYYVLKGSPLTEAPEELDRELERGTENIFVADSIAELAQVLDIDPATLEATVADYNAIVEAGEDPVHGKKDIYLTDKIETGPFYAFRVKGSAVNMFGGIHINSNVEVVREDMTVIPGLYAAGVECGGFQGETYGITVPSSCQGISLSTGRRGAKNAVAYARSL